MNKIFTVESDQSGDWCQTSFGPFVHTNGHFSVGNLDSPKGRITAFFSALPKGIILNYVKGSPASTSWVTLDVQALEAWIEEKY